MSNSQIPNKLIIPLILVRSVRMKFALFALLYLIIMYPSPFYLGTRVLGPNYLITQLPNYYTTLNYKMQVQQPNLDNTKTSLDFPNLVMRRANCKIYKH